jgi:MoaA/NifB/PqqE/SkfB family radical SAM enzyme
VDRNQRVEVEHRSEEQGARQQSVRRVEAYIAADPALRGRYERAKALRKVARYSNNYDMTSRCNLSCEGCYYFEGDDYKRSKEVADLAQWKALFEAEAARGVTFANFVGAEPSLVQERIALAMPCLPRGVIFSNGIAKIDRAINYTILLSVWGDEKATQTLRGASVLHKALRNYEGDQRARVLLTISAKNIDQIAAVTRIIADYGIKLSYNYFSPTESYLRKLANETPNDDEFYRLSSQADNMQLSSAALERVRDRIDDMIDTYPDIVFHSRAFNHAVTNPDGIYDVDPATNIARNCAGKHSSWHQTHRVDLKLSDGKCCTPNTNCKTCRLSSISLSSFMFRLNEFTVSHEAFVNWLDICDQWGQGHLLATDRVWANVKSEMLPEPVKTSAAA